MTLKSSLIRVNLSCSSLSDKDSSFKYIEFIFSTNGDKILARKKFDPALYRANDAKGKGAVGHEGALWQWKWSYGSWHCNRADDRTRSINQKVKDYGIGSLKSQWKREGNSVKRT